MPSSLLVIGATLCLVMALIEAWLLVARVSSDTGPIARLIPSFKELLRSHIDYLMMAQFLYIFYGLSLVMELALPGWAIAFACLGAFFNPFAFLIRAFKPAYLKAPPKAYTAMIGISSILTTIGFLAIAFVILKSALAAS